MQILQSSDPLHPRTTPSGRNENNVQKSTIYKSPPLQEIPHAPGHPHPQPSNEEQSNCRPTSPQEIPNCEKSAFCLPPYPPQEMSHDVQPAEPPIILPHSPKIAQRTTIICRYPEKLTPPDPQNPPTFGENPPTVGAKDTCPGVSNPEQSCKERKLRKIRVSWQEIVHGQGNLRMRKAVDFGVEISTRKTNLKKKIKIKT